MFATLYALRIVSTGAYMPQLKRPRYSLLDPENFSTKNPRLFWTHGGAARALSAWKKGVHERSSTTRDYFGEIDHDPGGYPVGEPPPERQIEVEIVEFRLQEQ